MKYTISPVNRCTSKLMDAKYKFGVGRAVDSVNGEPFFWAITDEHITIHHQTLYMEK